MARPMVSVISPTSVAAAWAILKAHISSGTSGTNINLDKKTAGVKNIRMFATPC